MSARNSLSLAVGFILLALSATAWSTAAPSKLSYQAVLQTAAGQPVTTPVTVVFTIYDAATLGNALWTESRNVNPDAAGRVNVLLGDNTPIGETVFNGPNRWLGIRVGADPEMPQRTQMAASAYSRRVSTVDGASGGKLEGNLVLQSTAAFEKDTEDAQPAQLTLISLSGDTIVLGPAEQFVFRATDPSGAERMSATVSGPNGPVFGVRDSGGNRTQHTASASSYYKSAGPNKDSQLSSKKMEVTADGIVVFGATESDTVAFVDNNGAVFARGLNVETGLPSSMSIKDAELACAVGNGNITNNSIGSGNGLFGTSYSMAVGLTNCINSGQGNFTVGQSNQLSGSSSFSCAIGVNNNVSNGNVFTAGQWNIVSGQGGVALGAGNSVSGFNGFAAGQLNGVSGNGGVALGASNTVSGANALGLGTANIIFSPNTFGSGFQNKIGTLQASAGSGALGYKNEIQALNSFAVGDSNYIGASASVAMGKGNNVTGSGQNMVFGNNGITSGAGDVVIGGGNRNSIIHASDAVIDGGIDNSIIGALGVGNLYCNIGGGNSNVINTTTDPFPGDKGASNIIGGSGNTITSSKATICGGFGNTVSGTFGIIVGGNSNVVTGEEAVVVGGDQHLASGVASVVVGGGTPGAIGGRNVASGAASFVGSGQKNTASGNLSAVPGGLSNSSVGDYSFAAGRRAKANHHGTFVWADQTDADFASERDDQFRVRADGGARFDDGTRWVNIYDDATDLITTSTGAHLTVGGDWTNSSDVNLKENFEGVDGEELLSRIASLSIKEWNYKAEGEQTRHIGPTAQDFYAAFGLGNDDVSISTIDPSGIALAAIQALDARTRELSEQKTEIDALRDQIAELKQLVESMARQR